MLLHNILGFRLEHGIKVYLTKTGNEVHLGLTGHLNRRDDMEYILPRRLSTERSKFAYSEPPDHFKYKKVLLFIFVIYFSE
jgi:hypothetical protein